jgi:hypothetical protein
MRREISVDITLRQVVYLVLAGIGLSVTWYFNLRWMSETGAGIEARRLGMRHWWVWPVLTFGIAFAFAFPLFLYFRDRRIEVIGQMSGSR